MGVKRIAFILLSAMLSTQHSLLRLCSTHYRRLNIIRIPFTLLYLSTNEKPRQFKEIKQDIIRLCKCGDIVNAKRIYETEIRPQPYTSNIIPLVCTYLGLLGPQNSEDAFSVVNDLRSRNIPLTEGAYIALIRSHCLAGDIDQAWRYIHEMQRLGLEVRLRHFQPFSDYCEENLDLPQLISLYDMCQKAPYFLELRSEHVLFVLRTYSRLKRQQRFVPSLLPILVEFLQSAQSKVFDLPSESLWEIMQIINNSDSVDVLKGFGVLVGSLSDIGGPIIDDKLLTVNGTLVAVNSTHRSNISWSDEEIMMPRFANPYLPNLLRSPNATADASPQRYIVRDQRKLLLSESEYKKETGLNGRVVMIGTSSCQCPQCGGKVNNVPMTSAQRTEFYNAIFRSASEISAENVAGLREFEEWLQQRPPGEHYDYILDGANIAYQNQNHQFGRFSYGQIKLVVDELKALGKRVLVILPACYRQNRIPNTVHASCRRFIYPSSNELSFCSDLEASGSLYLVPNYLKDDYFWMLATIYNGRTQPALVLSNDRMRDHRVSFIAPTAFNRWRASHIVHFNVMRTNPLEPFVTAILLERKKVQENATAVADSNNSSPEAKQGEEVFEAVGVEGEDEDEHIDSKRLNAAFIQRVIQHTLSKPLENTIMNRNELNVTGKVILYRPGNFTREIQQSSEQQTWHIPATDRMEWLCLKVALADSSDAN